MHRLYVTSHSVLLPASIMGRKLQSPEKKVCNSSVFDDVTGTQIQDSSQTDRIMGRKCVCTNGRHRYRGSRVPTVGRRLQISTKQQFVNEKHVKIAQNRDKTHKNWRFFVQITKNVNTCHILPTRMKTMSRGDISRVRLSNCESRGNNGQLSLNFSGIVVHWAGKYRNPIHLHERLPESQLKVVGWVSAVSAALPALQGSSHRLYNLQSREVWHNK